MTNTADFQFDGTVLTKYTGPGGHVTIPDGVTSVGKLAFFFCDSVTAVTIPDSVTSIGERGFYGCVNLTDLAIPDSVTSIGACAFERCKSLTNLTIPNSVTSIGWGAFLNCASLNSITIPDSITSIELRTFFGCTGLTSVTIPDSVTSIGEGAFSECKSLTSVTIPDSVTSIGGYAFGSCSGLTAVTIPNGVTRLDGSLFYGCSRLTSVTIPDSVTSIEGYAFQNCKNLSRINIPDSVTSIGDAAFSGCRRLADRDGFVIVRDVLYNYYGSGENVAIPDSVASMEGGAFSEGSALTTVSMNKAIFQDWWLEKANLGMAVRDGDRWQFYGYSSKAYDDNFKDFVRPGKWNAYDLELINNGPMYKYKAPARLLGCLGRLVDPVDLTDECRELHMEYLVKNAKKLIPIAEALRCPAILEAMSAYGIINDKNKKAIAKLLAASSVPEIAALTI